MNGNKTKTNKWKLGNRIENMAIQQTKHRRRKQGTNSRSTTNKNKTKHVNMGKRIAEQQETNPKQ